MCSASPADGRVAWIVGVDIARKFLRGIYAAVTLFAGHVLLNEIGVLQPHEFDGKAIFDMAHDAPLRLADRDDRTNRLAADPVRCRLLRQTATSR